MFGWDDLAVLGVSGLMNYLGNKKGEPTAPPAPSNYFNADGSFQVWNPSTNSYYGLGARTDPTMLATNAQSQLLMNQMLGGGGYDAEKTGLQKQIDDLKGSYVQGGNAQANAQVMSRISDLQSTMDGLKDVDTGYDPIGVTNPTRQLQYQGSTDTVNKYLTDTLDTGYKNAQAAQDTTLAQRGMGQSTMADWGRNDMAKNYATAKEGVAVQSEDYYRQLRAADESAKMGILQGAESGLGTNNAIQQGVNSASQAQESLAQQLASYNSNLQYNYQQQHDAWSNQQNQNIYSSLAGMGKMAAGGYYGGTAGMLGASPNFWSTGWGGQNYNPNRGGSNSTTSSSGGSNSGGWNNINW